MGDEVIRSMWMSALLLAAGSAFAQNAATFDLASTGDSEHFQSLRVRGGDLFEYASPFQYAGVTAQWTHYSQSGWNTDAPAALFLWRKQSRETLAGTIAEAGIVRVSDRMRIIGDAAWSVRPSTRTGFEVVAAGDLVETRAALEKATAYQFLAADVERQITPRVTAIALAGVQHFTDGNDRLHLRGRLIWQLWPSEGVNAQLRYRQFQSQDIAADYFNPRRYRQWDGGFYVRRRHAGWLWLGTVAAGRETIDGDDSRGTAHIELRAEGPLLRDMRFAAHISYDRSAGFQISDRYRYATAGLSIIVPIRR